MQISSLFIFGASTAPRAFELLTCFKRSVRYRSQAVRVYKRLRSPISIFPYLSFYSLHFPIELNGEMLIGQN